MFHQNNSTTMGPTNKTYPNTALCYNNSAIAAELLAVNQAAPQNTPKCPDNTHLYNCTAAIGFANYLVSERATPAANRATPWMHCCCSLVHTQFTVV